jgi:8-oxo-dGTP pyrophosphatase MutT (NUDIX family)
MADIICANAICVRDNMILLTREHADSQYYFPGGKVINNATIEETLERELQEELGYTMCGKPEFMFSHIGPAYGQEYETVKLNCFWIPDLQPTMAGHEIYDYRWIGLDEFELMAPVNADAIKKYRDELVELQRQASF